MSRETRQATEWLDERIRLCDGERERLRDEMAKHLKHGHDVFGQAVRQAMTLGLPIDVARAFGARMESFHDSALHALQEAERAVFEELRVVQQLNQQAGEYRAAIR